MLKLYFSPGSCALASHIALAEAGADYEPVPVDFERAEQTSPDYLAINPKGRVPALISEHGVLTETPAILAYIAQQFPKAGLAPIDDPFAFAQAQSFNSYLCSTIHVNHAHMSRGKRWADDPAALAEMTRKVPEANLAAFRLVEDGMLKGPWVLGDNYSMCDGYLYTVSRWLEREGIDAKQQLPRVAAHMEQMEARPATKRVLREHFG